VSSLEHGFLVHVNTTSICLRTGPVVDMASLLKAATVQIGDVPENV
jgi:hypothetical protein